MPKDSSSLDSTHFDPTQLIAIAKLGRSVGLKGLMKCQVITDFPEIFSSKISFFAQKSALLQSTYTKLTILEFNPTKMLIGFCEITSIEQAKEMTNAILYATLEDTKAYCTLKENEFFWFDLIGCEIIENQEILGCVENIERIGSIDYLLIATNPCLSAKLPKRFLIPYIDPFILSSHPSKKQIHTQNAKNLLENS